MLFPTARGVNALHHKGDEGDEDGFDPFVPLVVKRIKKPADRRAFRVTGLVSFRACAPFSSARRRAWPASSRRRLSSERPASFPSSASPRLPPRPPPPLP